jgi:hypothetical protein
MISEGPGWIEALPGALQTTLDALLEPEESLLVCVRGQPRHALAATERRLIRLEEPPLALTQNPAQVVATPWEAVRDLRLEETRAVARITWLPDGTPEPQAFEVPVYDLLKFRRILERLQVLAATAGREAGTQPTATKEPSMTAASTQNCPKCATAIPTEGAWCPGCGLQVADICGQCGAVLAKEWAFCARCGTSTSEPGVIPCPSCREPVTPGFAFCPRCGAAARALCEECDRPLRREWAYCPDCGASTSEERRPMTDDRPLIETPDARRQTPVTSGPGARRGYPPEAGHPGAASTTSVPEAERANEEGTRLYEANNLEGAIAAFRQAVALDPGNAGYHTNLAVALDEDEQDSDALVAYERAIELDPRETTALLNLGYMYSESERYEEARQVWEQVIRVDAGSADAEEARQNLRNLDEL